MWSAPRIPPPARRWFHPLSMRVRRTPCPFPGRRTRPPSRRGSPSTCGASLPPAISSRPSPPPSRPPPAETRFSLTPCRPGTAAATTFRRMASTTSLLSRTCPAGTISTQCVPPTRPGRRRRCFPSASQSPSPQPIPTPWEPRRAGLWALLPRVPPADRFPASCVRDAAGTSRT